jgi:hypothetical protein
MNKKTRLYLEITMLLLFVISIVINIIPIISCDSEIICEPGVVRLCPCSSGNHGTQACNDNGSFWENCSCPEIISRSNSNDPIIGEWNWFTNEIKYFHSDGTTTGNGLRGTWAKLNQRIYLIEWGQEWYDIVILSRDNNHINGYNQVGTNVTGNRR